MASSLRSFLSPQRLRDLQRSGIEPRELPSWTTKLIYSSYFEKLSPVFGYRRRIRDKIEVQREGLQNSIKANQFNNIPISLQLLSSSINSSIQNIESVEHENLRNKDALFQFPYRQFQNTLSFDKVLSKRIKPEVIESERNSPDSDWFEEYGTPDPTKPATNIPCGGCGAFLHCQDTAIPGYIPSERMKTMDNNELRTELCQRCYFLSHHNTALKVNISPEDYPKLLSQIKEKEALIILLVDLLDFPCSLWPGVIDILGTQRPVMLVGNKVDLLPRDSNNYLQHLTNCLERTAKETGLEGANLVHTSLISATTGFGVESLIDKIFSVWGFKGDIYLMGCTNVGKSSLFNMFLQSDLCKVQVVDLIQRATISPWPSTTLNLLKFPVTRPDNWRIVMRQNRLRNDKRSLKALNAYRNLEVRETHNPVFATLIGHVGRTFVDTKKLDEVDKYNRIKDIFHINPYAKIPNPVLQKKGDWDSENTEFIHGKWCFDTPGAVTKNQILDQLTLQELMHTIPKEIIQPRTYLIHPEMSLFVGGLARLDYKAGSRYIRLIVFTSQHLEINIVKTENAEEVYQKGLGGPIFGIPFGNEARLKEFPPLQGKKFQLVGVNHNLCSADIVISSTGWIGLNIGTGQKIDLEVFTPNGKGMFCRIPSFLPNVLTLKGKKLRGSLSYSHRMPFVPRQ